MIKFINFLLEEEEKGKPLTHLTHVEDLAIHGGHEGIGQAANFLEGMHNHLLGKKSGLNVSDKADGAPSIVYGTHPETGKFFVSSKSAFNKEPKINYTSEDIDRNHGHAPGLADKLKEALEHLPKIMPRKGGIFQGDMMYGNGDTHTGAGHVHFTPNRISYSVPENSAEGTKVKNSKIGLVTHTEYVGKGGLENMSAVPLTVERRKQFQDHPDINNIDPTQTENKVNPRNYSAEDQAEFHKHMDNARKAYATSATEMFDSIHGHQGTLEQHINDQVRKKGKPSTDGYVDFLKEKAQKDIDKVKLEKTKQQKHQALSNKIEHIMQNKKHFDRLLAIHGHLQKAKDVLIRTMNKNSHLENNPLGKTSINGVESAGEGAVATDKQGNMTKFVDRGEGGFAHANLTTGKFQKVSEETEIKHVTTFGRFNPMTTGHEKLVNHVQNLAKKLNAGHSIVMSHSNDTKKNPLTIQQKLKHAKRAFPTANIKAASPEHPTILHHLSKLHDEGITHPTIVVGQDRVEEFKNLIGKYNGKQATHGHYNFKHVDVQSAGQRDPDAEGTEGASGTKMREFAKNGDRESFHHNAPSSMSSEHKDEMMKDTAKGLHVPENPKVEKIVSKVKQK